MEDRGALRELISFGAAGLETEERGQGKSEAEAQARVRSRRDPGTLCQESGLYSKDKGKPSKGLRSRDTLYSYF